MARGQVLQIASGTNQTVSTQSREEKSSYVVYNPNDGVCYFKLNGPASPAAGGYDWKLPAQSGGAFGGPWQSLGIYFLDQSGAGRQGEVNLFDSDQEVHIPNIWAIGRSLQAQVTTLDVTEGTQPANPSAGVARLWVDNNGKLWELSSGGVLVPYLDPANLVLPLSVNGTIRSVGETDPAAGAGAELLYQSVYPRGVLQAFDWGGGAYVDLLLAAKNIIFAPGGGGVVQLGIQHFEAQLGVAVTLGTAWASLVSINISTGIWAVFSFQVVLNTGTGAVNTRTQIFASSNAGITQTLITTGVGQYSTHSAFRVMNLGAQTLTLQATVDAGSGTAQAAPFSALGAFQIG